MFVFAVELTAFSFTEGSQGACGFPGGACQRLTGESFANTVQQTQFWVGNYARYSLTMAATDSVSATTATMMTIMVS